jgi:hypothetical protein
LASDVEFRSNSSKDSNYIERRIVFKSHHIDEPPRSTSSGFSFNFTVALGFHLKTN